MNFISSCYSQHCSKGDPPCPTVFFEKLSFGMRKTFLEVFLRLALDEENQMIRPPKSQTACHHGSVQPCCPFSTPPSQAADGSATTLGTLCPSSEEIKYRMTCLSVDLVDFTLVGTGSAMGIQIYPLRLSTCNLYSAGRCTAECLSSFRKSTRANSWARPVAHHLTIRLQR